MDEAVNFATLCIVCVCKKMYLALIFIYRVVYINIFMILIIYRRERERHQYLISGSISNR